jgi:hypothetical protein
MPAVPRAPWARARHALLLGIALVVATGGPVAQGSSPGRHRQDQHRGSPSRSEQLALMWAMAGQESGWDYFSRNAVSGAFGKYQIMPSNWPSWAEKYLGDRHADQTPANQERVAYGKLRDLYGWLGSWRRVAYWWLTGSREPDERRWSAYARRYVRNIMALRKQAPRDGGLPAAPAAGSFLDPGDWRRAESVLRLRLSPGGRVWPEDGRLAAGQLVRIRATTRADGLRWLRVVTVDGRRGWVKAVRTVPTTRPARPGRWSDVQTDGHGRQARDGRGRGDGRPDRSRVRPRPR